MRLLLLGKYDFDDLPGGIERYCKLFLDNLPKEVEATAVYFNKDNKNEVVQDGRYVKYKVGVWKTVASTALSFSIFSALKRVFQKTKPEVVFLQFPNPMMHLGYLYAKSLNSKLVIYWHSDIVRQKKLLWIYRPLLENVLRRANAIIVHSKELTQSKQLSVCKPNKIHVIPIGVTAPVVLNNHFFTAGKSEQFKLFACGRHVGYKGFDYLLRSLSLLPEDVTLILGGVGPETEKLQQLAKDLNIDHRVNFVGFITEEEKGAYINDADLYCFPSISQNEAFGIAQIEAMLLAKPVVGFELFNGTTYVNKHNISGLVVENKNVQAYADAVMTLKNNSNLCQKLGQQAQERARKLFGVDKMVHDTLKVFKALN